MWQERFSVLIAPHPALREEHKAIVAKGYGMREGTTSLNVQYATLFYALKRLILLGTPNQSSARS